MRTCINHGPLPDTNFYPNTSNNECRRYHNARCKHDHARAEERLKELQQRLDEQEAAEALERKFSQPREIWNPDPVVVVKDRFQETRQFSSFAVGPRKFRPAWKIC